ncbi:hypothetical protein [Cryobacterium sp. Hz9]|uniref:hypothetical protein n=1 Tax=Cryobacterium sp. Hz9 TaxID=1259167 RepID=UPI00106C832D|nr:hypothetical protein [Cryobacterium sp. Hz9]TFB65828.1 hypothetical protein E3N85_12210 [Cryobacterium sp. Hz9]
MAASLALRPRSPVNPVGADPKAFGPCAQTDNASALHDTVIFDLPLFGGKQLHILYAKVSVLSKVRLLSARA